MEHVCPVSVDTTVGLQLHGEDKKQFEWLTVPDAVSSTPESTVGTYNLNRDMSPLNLGVTWKEAATQQQSHPALIQVRRYQTGFGQERGGLTVDIVNSHPSRSCNVTYLETTPWILKLFLHTLTLSLNDDKLSIEKNEIIKDLYYQPSIDRKRPSVLELALELPPNSKVTLAIAYETTYLKYTEYPPDANRGFDIGWDSFFLN
jgi:phosphatidylinositol glycan class T